MKRNFGDGWGLSRRNLLLSTATLLAAPHVALAADNWQATVDAANAEGEVLLYSSKSDSDNAALIGAFMKQYPKIRAKVVRLVGGAMIARVDQEVQANALAVDVMVHSEQQWIAPRAAAGKFVVPTGPSLNLWKGAEQYYANGVVRVTGEPWVIGYNTDVVKNAPTDWDSLLHDQRFKGQIGLDEVTGLTVVIWYDFIEKKKPGYFEALAQLRPRLYANATPLTEALSSGELAWAPYSVASSIEPVKASGAPVDWVLPSSGTWAFEREALIFKEAPHLNAARVLVDFMMSVEGQRLLNANHGGFSVVPGIHLPDALNVDLSKIERVNYTEYGPDKSKEWQARVDKLFRQ
jgi:iron(III) transport system substrate-binding protein